MSVYHPASECPRLTGCPLCADPEHMQFMSNDRSMGRPTLSGNDPANESPERVHRLVQFAHEGYTPERLAFVFYAETKAIFKEDHSYESLDAAMRELLSAMEDAREIIGD